MLQGFFGYRDIVLNNVHIVHWEIGWYRAIGPFFFKPPTISKLNELSEIGLWQFFWQLFENKVFLGGVE